MCSGIRIICKNGTIFVGRTLEFGTIFNYKKVVSDNIIGITADGYFIDGINKDGLYIGAFYFLKHIQYSDSSIQDNNNISSIEMTGFLLNNAKNIQDVKNLCSNITILNKIYPPQGIVLPLHWFCCDKNGNCIVIECVHGVTMFYDDAFGIITNSPKFPEHLQLVQNYPTLSPYNNPTNNQYYFSNGTGMIGLPGDFTSESRFERLFMFQKFHIQPENSKEGMNVIFHILNNFDIVKGYDVNTEGNFIFTQYTSVYNLTDFEGFMKTYLDQHITNIKDVDEVVVVERFEKEDYYYVITTLVSVCLFLIIVVYFS